MIIYNDKHEETRKMIRAVIYIRFSSKMQAESFSIEYQQEECLKYIESKGYKFVGEYIDKAKTGKKTAGREALEQMLYDAGRNKFDKIIVFSFSRSFRNTRDALNTNDQISKQGVVIESVIEPIDLSSPHGKFSGTNLFAMHELQSDIIAAHVKSGMYIAAKQGYFLGGIINLGYSTYETGEFSRGKARKKYCINEEEAVTVRWIFKMYADGFSIPYIVDELIKRGFRGRSGEFMSLQGVSRILRNEFFIGVRKYNVKGYEPLYIENAVPAIIDKDTWEICQERNRSNMKHKRRTAPRRKHKRYYALTGKIVCGNCGKHFAGEHKGENKKKGYGGYSYYACSTKKNHRTCHVYNIRKDILEHYCIQQIKKHILTPDKIKEIAAYIMSQTDGTPDLVREDFEVAEKRKRKVLDIIKKAKREKYEMDEAEQEAQDELIAEYSKELSELNAKLARLENLEQTVISEEMILNFLEECLVNIDSPDPHVVKSVFDRLIEKIIIHDDKVEVYLIVIPFSHSALKVSTACPTWSLGTEINREHLTAYSYRSKL